MRHAGDPRWCFNVQFNTKFWKSTSVCNQRMQCEGLTKAGYTEALTRCITEYENLDNELENMIELAKEQAKEHSEFFGQEFLVIPTRRTISIANMDQVIIDLTPYTTTIAFAIKELKQALEADRATPDDQLLTTAIKCEQAFSSFTYVKSDYRDTMGNPLLFLGIYGLQHPVDVLQIDTDDIAKEFLHKS